MKLLGFLQFFLLTYEEFYYTIQVLEVKIKIKINFNST